MFHSRRPPARPRSRRQCGGQLGVAARRQLAVQAPGERSGQPAAELGTLRDAGGQQVVAVDRQADMAPLGR